MNYYQFLLESKQASEKRLIQLKRFIRQYYDNFGTGAILDLYIKEKNLLIAQINEIDQILTHIACGHHKAKAENTGSSEPISGSEPKMYHNLNSNSHYWNVVGGKWW